MFLIKFNKYTAMDLKTTGMLYLLRLSKVIQNITTAMVNFISSIKRENRYGE